MKADECSSCRTSSECIVWFIIISIPIFIQSQNGALVVIVGLGSAALGILPAGDAAFESVSAPAPRRPVHPVTGSALVSQPAPLVSVRQLVAAPQSSS